MTIPHGGVRSGDGREAVSSPPGAKELARAHSRDGEAPNRSARRVVPQVGLGGVATPEIAGRWRRPGSVDDELEPAREECQNWKGCELSGVVLKLGKETAGPEVVATTGSTWGWPRRCSGRSWGRRGSEQQPFGLGPIGEECKWCRLVARHGCA